MPNSRGLQADCDFALVINLSFYRFSIRSCLATSHKHSVWRHRAFWVSIQHGHRLGLILFILCLLYVGESPGESQSISEANNTGLQTHQCPIGQVAGIPCRGRFNTERTVTWTLTRAVKKKTSALGAVVAWPSGMKPHFFSPEEVGVQVPIRVGLLPFFFLHRVFTLWLVAVDSHCWTVLASRDFYDKVLISSPNYWFFFVVLF